jgi:cardiolipin synthase
MVWIEQMRPGTRPASRGTRCAFLLAALLCTSCSLPHSLRVSPGLEMRQPAFLATIGAYTDARFVGGNRVDILLDGDGTFPPLLDAIRPRR